MGNASSHLHERRKSGGISMFSGRSTVAETNPHSAHHATSSAMGPVGVNVSKGGNTNKSPNKFLGGSAFSRTVKSFRPRAATGDSSNTGSFRPPRPRATTFSSGPQRPQAQRCATVDLPDNLRLISSPSPSSLEPQMTEFLDQASLEPSKKLPTILKYSGDAKEVYVYGTFNNWQKMKMSRSAKDFVAIVDLKEGDHEYKFLVDGKWTNDPNAPKVTSKDGVGKGVENNVIRVQKEDFDAYHALDMDSKAVSLAQQNQKRLMFSDAYTQEVPSYTSSENRSGPPILPPHLLQVILNKDTAMSCEPTLLPEPNHVMLNHLYALSIKEGVMVLSSTQRYKRKYVTTLLYKPLGQRKT